MSGPTDWERFFDACAPHYLKWSFTKDTDVEIEFLCNELDLPAGASILDIGCGTGRHAVALAKRGFRMTGIDLSRGMLREASRAAQAAGVKVDFVHADATTFRTDRKFDAVICLCEGAFTLIGSGDDPWEHDLAIL